jgi:hypothetical protein
MQWMPAPEWKEEKISMTLSGAGHLCPTGDERCICNRPSEDVHTRASPLVPWGKVKWTFRVSLCLWRVSELSIYRTNCLNHNRLRHRLALQLAGVAVLSALPSAAGASILVLGAAPHQQDAVEGIHRHWNPVPRSERIRHRQRSPDHEAPAQHLGWIMGAQTSSETSSGTSSIPGSTSGLDSDAGQNVGMVGGDDKCLGSVLPDHSLVLPIPPPVDLLRPPRVA